MTRFENPIALVRALKGAPLSVLFALFLLKQPVTQEFLERTTGYTDKPVSQALAYLQENGLIQKVARGWLLTGEARQLPLPLTMLEDGGGEEPSRNYSDSQSLEEVNLNSSTVVVESRDGNFPTPEPTSERILGAAERLLGKPIYGRPADFDDPELLLGWIAQAYHCRGLGRGQVRDPASMVSWAFHKGRGKKPDQKYLDRPADFLPPSFLADIGVITIPQPAAEAPEPGIPEAEREDDNDEVLEPDGQEPFRDPSVHTPVTPTKTAEQAWKEAVEHLQLELPKSAFENYIQGACLIGYDAGKFTILAPSAYARNWLDGRLTSILQRLLTGICNRAVTVRFVDSEVSPQ